MAMAEPEVTFWHRACWPEDGRDPAGGCEGEEEGAAGVRPENSLRNRSLWVLLGGLL
eukprot:COSAG02_NODE_1285_length_13457_cov_11.145606_10_plen_57_part_00